jgi:hypothetical protein
VIANVFGRTPPFEASIAHDAARNSANAVKPRIELLLDEESSTSPRAQPPKQFGSGVDPKAAQRELPVMRRGLRCLY